jgi:peroxiredoxin family protein
MTMEIDRIANRIAAGVQSTQEQSIQTSQQEGASAILGGASVTVTRGASSDLERLVLRLKSESAETRQDLAQRRISLLSTVLDGMAERISQKEHDALLEIEGLESANTALQSDIVSLTASKATAIANRDALQAQIESLEKLTENEIKNGEDHRELIEKLKAQKAEEDAKIQACENAISAKSAQITANTAKISTLISGVGAATLREVAAAVKAAAGAEELAEPEDSESASEREKAEKKAELNDPAAVLREALDRLDAEIEKTLEENQAIKA